MLRRSDWPKRLAVFLWLMALILLPACAQTPQGRWFQARDALSTAQDLTVIAFDAGKIDNETMVEVVAPVSRGARAALEKAEEHLPGGGEAYDSIMLVLDSYLAELQRLYATEGTK